MSEFKDVHAERGSLLDEIRRKVKEAFDHPTPEHFVGVSSQEVLARAGSNRTIISKLSPDAPVVFTDESYPGEVFVNNPHDYKFLLDEALRELNVRAGNIWDEQQLTRRVNADLTHEFAHHVPALAQEGLRIQYGVEVLQDQVTYQLGVRPKVIFIGATTRGVYEDIFSSPADLSTADKRTLGKE